MPWTATILTVETRFDSVQVQLQIDGEPGLSFQKSYEFRQAEDLTLEAIKAMAQEEVRRIGGIFQAAEILRAEINRTIDLEA